MSKPKPWSEIRVSAEAKQRVGSLVLAVIWGGYDPEGMSQEFINQMTVFAERLESGKVY